MSTQLAGLGHNIPPEPFVELNERRNALAAVANKWITERPEITNQEVADKLDLFIKQTRTFEQTAEKERKAEVEPLNKAKTEIQRRYAELLAPIQKAVAELKPRLAAYLQIKERKRQELERKAREEAERKAYAAEEARQRAEEETRKAQEGESTGSGSDVIGAQVEAEAAAREAEEAARAAEHAARCKAQVKGDYGRATVLRSDWKARFTDYDAALNHLKEHPDLKAAIQKVCNGLARSPATRKMPIPGVEFYEEKVL